MNVLLLLALAVTTGAPVQLQAADIKFNDAPGLPHGTQLAVLEGNPRQTGLFTLRLRVTPKFKLPLHTHPNDERVTVIDGSINVQLQGEKAPKKNDAGT
jgi:quercetin dioxygenase-like cupin family protein